MSDLPELVRGAAFKWDPTDLSPENLALGVLLLGKPVVQAMLKDQYARGAFIIAEIDREKKTITLRKQ